MLNKHSNLAFFIPHLGCPYKCVFCDQVNISGEHVYPDPMEVKETCDRYLPKEGINTEIAFFGGSFTAIPKKMMEAYLQAAYPFVESGRASGIRISTRPDYIDDSILSTLKSYGVHSIELGAQSMNDQVLELNGRGHSSKDVTMASSLIREFGFSLGLQMMVGMYGVEDAYCDAMETADAFLKIAPDTVRIYPTLVVEDTQLAELWRRGVYKPLDIDEAVKISAELMILFRNKGIRVIRVGLHSENSLQKKTLAGPFHPAFGELCESLIFRNEIENVIIKEKTAIIKCNPKLLSKIIGQNKSNINYFLNKGMDIKVVPDSTVSRFHIEYP